MTEILVSWIITLVSLPLCALVLYHVRETNYEVEAVTHVEDVDAKDVGGVAAPRDHQVGSHIEDRRSTDGM